MNPRRAFLLGGSSALLVAMSRASWSAKVFRLGFLSPVGRPGPAINALMSGLRELGYVEGRNVAVEVRYADEKLERLPELAAELVALRVDVLVPLGPPATRAAKQATKSIPIVLAGNVDPVGTGLVASLARPQGNITGMSTLAADAASKRLELLVEMAPRVKRVGVFWDPQEPEEAAEWKALEAAARALTLTLVPLPVPAFGDVEKVFREAGETDVHALVNAGYLGPPRYRGKAILELASKRRIPAAFGWPGLVSAGGLFSYNPDFSLVFRRAATYIDKILNGVAPADLPIEQPTKFELVINMKAARTLGLSLPAAILLRADQVLQ